MKASDAPFMRTIHARYEDPLDRLWITCAERVGLSLVREAGAYASTDGRGTLRIAIPSEFDADDSLAQMIFHELCHALVEGPEAFEREDWGLDNTSDDDVLREHACIRTQAFLARSRGLGTFLAPTTDFRAFHDALGPDPLVRSEGEAAFNDARGAARSIELAKKAIARVDTHPWSPHLTEALDATASLADTLRSFLPNGTTHPLASLWTKLEARSGRHVVSFPLAREGTEASRHTCGDCGFGVSSARGLRCRKARRATRADAAACERWEPTLRCEDCGACCREAFDVIEVQKNDPFARAHRSLLVVRDDGSFDLPRPSGRCPPLSGDGSSEAPYRCALHAERPRTCHEFAVGSDACLTARRRVGRST